MQHTYAPLLNILFTSWAWTFIYFFVLLSSFFLLYLFFACFIIFGFLSTFFLFLFLHFLFNIAIFETKLLDGNIKTVQNFYVFIFRVFMNKKNNSFFSYNNILILFMWLVLFFMLSNISYFNKNSFLLLSFFFDAF